MMGKNKTANNSVADSKIAKKSALDEDDEINNQLVRILDGELLDGEKIIKGAKLKKGRTYLEMLAKLFLPFLLLECIVLILLFVPMGEEVSKLELVLGLTISGVLFVSSLIFALVLANRISKNTYLALTNKRVIIHQGIFVFDTIGIDFEDIYSLKSINHKKQILATSSKDYLLSNFGENEIFKLIAESVKNHQKTQK